MSGVQVAKLIAGLANYQAGRSVSLSRLGDTIVVSAVGYNGLRGAAYVFVNTGGGWLRTDRVNARDGEPGDQLGLSVSLSSDASTIVAGAPVATVDSKFQQGAAYVFVSDGLTREAQLFGLLSTLNIDLVRSSTIGFVNQSQMAPMVGTGVAHIGGPTSYLTGDLIASAAVGTAIELQPNDTVIGTCVSGGGQISLGKGSKCASLDENGGNDLLMTLSDAQGVVANYASFLTGLKPTTNIGDLTLKKNQSVTIKLGSGLSIVSIGNITTAGSDSLTLSAPKDAVVVLNVSGAVSLGGATHLSLTGGLNPHNLIWNIESLNPTFGVGVTLGGTVLNVAQGTAVTFQGSSSINGAVLTSGDIISMGAMHLNFWPFSGSAAASQESAE